MNKQNQPSYTIRRTRKPPSIRAEVGTAPEGWDRAEVGQVAHWHAKSGPHRPPTYFRALYDADAIYVRFDVMDRHVRSLLTEPQSSVCGDSCVEFFVQPAPGPAYFNFEINAGGTPLLYYIENPRRRRIGGFTKYRPVEADWLKRVTIGHSLPRTVSPTIHEPIAWALAFRIPLELFAAHLGRCRIKRGDVWRGNFYKCGGDPDFKHWGAWSDVGRRLNFHKPYFFGNLLFD